MQTTAGVKGQGKEWREEKEEGGRREEGEGPALKKEIDIAHKEEKTEGEGCGLSTL